MNDARKATEELGSRTIKAKSSWEAAQGLMHSKEPLNDKIEVEIPGVMSLSKDGDNYLIYVHIGDEVVRLSNIEGVGNSESGESVKGKHDGEEHTGVSK